MEISRILSPYRHYLPSYIFTYHPHSPHIQFSIFVLLLPFPENLASFFPHRTHIAYNIRFRPKMIFHSQSTEEENILFSGLKMLFVPKLKRFLSLTIFFDIFQHIFKCYVMLCRRKVKYCDAYTIWSPNFMSTHSHNRTQ